MFTLSYKKNNNQQLFKSLEENSFSKPQNYVPLYKRFTLYCVIKISSSINKD